MLTEDIIVAKEEAWAKRAIEDYNRRYRLLQHPLAHEIKYKMPSSSGGDDHLDRAEEDDESDGIITTHVTAPNDNDAIIKLRLRGRVAAARRPSS
jgi:hypothetical protein